MNLSYNAWKTYCECPKKYYLKYRLKESPTVPQNDYFALYGCLVEKFFTMFSNLWRFKSPYMPENVIREKTAKLYDDLLTTSTVIWNAPFAKFSKQDILAQAQTDICAIMDSHNQNFFFNTKSEIDIKVSTSVGIDLTGRIDFIHEYPLDKRILLFDGKGTDKIGKNIDPNQVLFYSLLYYFHFKRIPDEVGFFYYRFNEFSPVHIDMETINTLRAKVSLDIKDIASKTSWEAKPCTKACKYCDYRNTCIERLEKASKHRRKSKMDIQEEGTVTLFGL